MRNWFLGPSCALLAFVGVMPAFGQSASPLLQGDIPFEYSRERNISVTDRARPEYNAIGIPAGGFTILPNVDISPGFTDNVYSRQNKT